MRHIHADNICIAANDTSIEWQRMSNKDWANVGKSGSFTFFPDSEYRQRPAPHPHQAMIDQAAADPSIVWQYRRGGSDWQECSYEGAAWDEDTEYRQKPKMVDMWQWVVRMMYSKQITFTNFYATEAEAAIQVGKSGFIICRIEGSKITVPEVSQ
jgi:hypothetical protein